jgi:endonuclease YncB( thermonuclease family)
VTAIAISTSLSQNRRDRPLLQPQTALADIASAQADLPAFRRWRSAGSIGVAHDRRRQFIEAKLGERRAHHCNQAILTRQTKAIDGDTIEIGAVPVRLKGIAAPERNEPGGAEATEAMRRLIGDREVRCALTGERGRTAGQ